MYVGSILVMPLLTKHAIDEVIVPGKLDGLQGYLWIFLGIGAVRGIFGGFRKYLAMRLMALVGNDLRGRIHEHLQRLSFSYHDQLGPGQLMSRASSDVTAVESVVTGMPFFVQSSILGIGGAVALFLLQPLLAGVVLAEIIVLAVIVLRLAGPINEVSREFQSRIGTFTQYVSQQIQGIRVVKGHGLESVHKAEGERLNQEVRDSGVLVNDLRARYLAAFIALPGAAVLVVVGLGGWLAMEGRISPGGLMAFLQYLGALVAPVMVVAQQMAKWPEATASAARINEVLQARADVKDPRHPKPLPSGPGKVVFDHVTFGYHEGITVLDDFSLQIEPGESVAFVGITGCGKSTVARLLPRFYDPWEGRVILDGVPVHELSLDPLRRAVSIVFEDTVVFTSSIRENIALGLPTASFAQVRRAAELAQADEFIRELANGYDTVLGESGMSLSGGQRQRLAIARAILRNPRVLILDDATSAVDPATDEAIWKGLSEVVRNRTTLIIAHRPETLVLANKVVLMHRGRIVEQGTHDDLLELPVYRMALGLSNAIPELKAG